MDYSTREMTIHDYEEVYTLGKTTPGLSLEESDTQESIALYLRRNPGLCFVAIESDRIGGAVLCGHEGRRGILRHLAVRKGYRGEGIARELVNRCLSSLARQGIKKCNTFVLDENVEGLRFWKHMGWYTLEDNYRTLQIQATQNEGQPEEPRSEVW